MKLTQQLLLLSLKLKRSFMIICSNSPSVQYNTEGKRHEPSEFYLPLEFELCWKESDGGWDVISCLPPCAVYFMEGEFEQINMKIRLSIKDSNN